jgi:hypothetical protein
MNKNYPKYVAVMLSFAFINPSFAMGGKVFKLARIVGITASPAYGLYDAYVLNKHIEDSYDNVEHFSDAAIEEWGREKMKQFKVPHAESIVFDHYYGWGTSGKIIYVPTDESNELNKALKNKEDRIIAYHLAALKHEIGHIINKDPQHKVYAKAMIPLGVEALSFGATKIFRKVGNISPQPKTFLKTGLRSCFAIGAIMPKLFMSRLGLSEFSKYQEARADKFALEHAESRLEFEELIKRYSKKPILLDISELFKLPTHPTHDDRKAMVEKYKDKWDKDHADETGKRA